MLSSLIRATIRNHGRRPVALHRSSPDGLEANRDDVPCRCSARIHSAEHASCFRADRLKLIDGDLLDFFLPIRGALHLDELHRIVLKRGDELWHSLLKTSRDTFL